MIVIAGNIEIDASSKDAANAAAIVMMRETAKEAGCALYRFAWDMEFPNRIIIVEEWASEDALKAHFASLHMAAFQKAMGGFKILGRSIKRYEVSSAASL